MCLIWAAGCPLSFENGGTMGYNCCFFLNFVPLHIESPYNFGSTGPILGVKKTSAEGKWACWEVVLYRLKIYTGMHSSLMRKMRLPFIDSDLSFIDSDLSFQACLAVC